MLETLQLKIHEMVSGTTGMLKHLHASNDHEKLCHLHFYFTIFIKDRRMRMWNLWHRAGKMLAIKPKNVGLKINDRCSKILGFEIWFN